MKTSPLLLAILFFSSLTIVVEANDHPGQNVLESLEKTIIPSLIFENVSFADAMSFVGLRLRGVQKQTHPELGGISIIYNVQRMPEDEDDLSDPPNHSVMIPSYRAKDKPVLELINDLCRIAQVNAHITSVGIVLSPAGTPPFPNPKATEGEIWHTLFEADQKP
ncbi:MAG: hypothetical protein ACNA8L_10565 [Luteolibacter sp.]